MAEFRQLFGRYLAELQRNWAHRREGMTRALAQDSGKRFLYQHLRFSLSRFPSNPFHVWMIAPMCKRILVIVLLFAWVTLSEFDHTDFPVKRVYSNPTFNLDFIVRSAHHAVLQHIINLAVIIVPYSVVLVSTFHRQFRLYWLNRTHSWSKKASPCSLFL